MHRERLVSDAMRAMHDATRDDEDYRATFLELGVALLRRATGVAGTEEPAARIRRLDTEVVAHMLSDAPAGTAERRRTEIDLARRLMGPAMARGMGDDRVTALT